MYVIVESSYCLMWDVRTKVSRTKDGQKTDACDSLLRGELTESFSQQRAIWATGKNKNKNKNKTHL